MGLMRNVKHYLKIAATIGVLCPLIDCTSVYLEKVSSSFTIPDSGPIPASERDAGETRLSVGVLGNARSKSHFNDGRHSDIEGDDSSKNSPQTNHELNVPNLQWNFTIDYTPLKHFFMFWKGNFGLADDKFTGAANMGFGTHFIFHKIALQGFISPTLVYLRSKGIVMISDHGNDLFYQGDRVTMVNNYSDKNICIGLGGGVQLSANISNGKMHPLWGCELQLQKYFDFDYDTLYNNYRKKYFIFFFTPNMGFSRTIRNSQFDAVLRWPIPIYSGEDDYYCKPTLFYPMLSVTYSICIPSRKKGKEQEVELPKDRNAE